MKTKRIASLWLCLVLVLALILPTYADGVNHYFNADYLESYANAAYREEGLGAVYTKTATTWKVWSPLATHVQLRLYKTGSDEEPGANVIGTYDMTQDAKTGVWAVKLDGDFAGVFYSYLVTNRGVTKETRDIYAKAAGVNGRRSMVVNLDETDPNGWDQDQHVLLEESTDAVIWEVHVRDFSVSPTSGVSEANRGKYLAFTEDNTTLGGKSGEVSTCLSYLKEMGVNTVHLLPVYDFGSVDETVTDDPTNRNWGYDPVNYNVPEGSYSTNPYDGVTRIKEFKQMIQALHEAGISVVMDVVYNHTYDLDNYQWGRVLINNAFNDTVPGYYFRMSDATHWLNGSGCGNVTASDKLMYRKYMVESVLYWAEEYHIDGFRFDLMGCHDVPTMNLIRASLDELYSDGSGKQILMYGEPWTGGDAGIVNGCTQNNAKAWGMSDRIGLFCDWLRDGIKGNPDDDLPGWVQGSNDRLTRDKGEVIVETNENDNRLRGGLNADDGRLNVPSQTVTYCDAHDNLILWDKLLKSQGSSEWNTYSGAAAEKYLKQLRLAETYLMVSQGMQFQVAGTEFARSKQGDHNSYNAPDDINAIDWTARKTNKAGSDFYKGLISIRFSFSPITDPVNRYKGRYENWLSDDPGLIAFWIDNTAEGEWSKLVVILNNYDQSRSVSLPAGSWTVVSNGIAAGTKSLGTATGSYTVEGFGSAILCQGYQPTAGFTTPLLLSANLILNLMNNR